MQAATTTIKYVLDMARLPLFVAFYNQQQGKLGEYSS